MRRFVIHLLILAGLGAAGGLATVFFGLYNVSAAVGHWPGVSWVLHTTFRNSVKLRAPSEDQLPDLDAPGLAAIGAGHYDSACRMCHGAPGDIRSATIQAMVPVPPPIKEAVKDWQPAELFWIAKNGIKMSGMPAWPSPLRDSDVWPVVAFLTDVTDMDADTYRSLTARGRHNDPVIAYCAMCHGVDGGGLDNPVMPRLDTLSEAYLVTQLEAYRDGFRQGGIMQHAASRLSDADLQRVAAHYAAATPVVATTSSASPDVVARGKALATAAGLDGVPACAACHGPWDAALPAENPPLAGQRHAYLLEQMRLWRDGKRGGSGRAQLMHAVSEKLEDADLESIAAYYSSLAPASPL